MRRILILWIFVTIMQPAVALDDTDRSDRPTTAIPVFEGDSDRPYRVIGEIRDNLRKHFAFQKNPTKEKIYAELWERGRKMGADAVINARFGPTQATPFNHGRTPISGLAIKFDELGRDPGM